MSLPDILARWHEEEEAAIRQQYEEAITNYNSLNDRLISLQNKYYALEAYYDFVVSYRGTFGGVLCGCEFMTSTSENCSGVYFDDLSSFIGGILNCNSDTLFGNCCSYDERLCELKNQVVSDKSALSTSLASLTLDTARAASRVQRLSELL